MNDSQLQNLVEQITREVVASLASTDGGCSRSAGGSCAECMLCVQLTPDRVGHIVDAGASRLTTTLGARPDPGVAGMIDHTLLKPVATREMVGQLCYEARTHRFISVCVNPYWVEFCSDQLAGSGVKVCAVVGFPLGATTPETKLYETEQCLLRGATELDMVINIGALKSRMYDVVHHDIQVVADACRRAGALSKVIIEAGLLTEEEKVRACEISKAAGADYVKTSTGFGAGGATVEDVSLMRRVVGSTMGVKASGGVGNLQDAQNMIQAGASRIGASAGIKIVRESGGA